MLIHGNKVRCDDQSVRELAAALSPPRTAWRVAPGVYFLPAADSEQEARDAGVLSVNGAVVL